MTIYEAVLKLVMKEPFYGFIASKLSIRENSLCSGINIKVYPQMELTYNLKWFNSLTDNEKLGYIIHELLHIIFYHPFRRGDRDKQLWATACDIAVNQYIPQIYLTENFVTISTISELLGRPLELFRSSEYYYNEIKNTKFTSKVKSSIIEDQELSNSNLNLIKESIQTSFKNNKDGIYKLNELSINLGEGITNSSVNWRLILKKFLSKRGKIDIRKSYKRESRRFDHYPGNRKSNGIEALVALDESASMKDETIEMYINELMEINKITGAKIKITQFDSTCTQPVSLGEYIKNTQRVKKG
ncbi:MAG: hypothetical protein JXR64_01500, partial [Spirochaetales bacterium]|nr:hypothetical protein [Spirochaetales bacterium]